MAAFHVNIIDRMRESIELPLVDSSLQPRIALAQVAVKLKPEVSRARVRSPDLESLTFDQRVIITMCAP